MNRVMFDFLKKRAETRNIEIEWRKTIRMAGTNMNGLTRKDVKKFRGQAIAEPDNLYDSNAVAIIREDGKKLGYIPAERAERVATKLAKYGGSVSCVGEITQEKEYDSSRTFFVGYVQLLWK